ncbi:MULTISPECIES: LysR family transcriptional regulator [unclassified Gordonia (in: high G+C Gram-positive bacteria)]|uniref:LysR family transcriptional regulator n=1 Tax=unclassified Gordonia (in: high G+C Gram-positive bacteria) TaxID=2657482 RepID=UPI0007E9784E|nr:MULTISPECIES: LysR family transcriptional regulator [unclassified Gordonia (in: high G+C Gram-positive bacteria)]OBB99638.1 hypothetical protein A5785_19885 [Gordonia sp. 852002-50395_SCH5434458]OBC13889.1 hypothetical protein A5788_18495 [Gordonia sp. 852002-50816_SCH5313054-c]OBC16197.1 hypothetical protein A5786_20680 [Gordonia sp. 852002-50816_SCH5313054-a]
MNLRDLDVRLLYTLEAIHRTGSISQAADELGVSQPAVSHSLRRLRTTFDDQLFVRTPTGMLATQRGEYLAGAARRIRAVVDDELDSSSTFDPGRLERTFRIFMTDSAEMVLLPQIMHRLRARAPRINIASSTLPPDAMVEALDRGLADLAVGPFPELSQSGLRRERLYRRGFLCLAARDQPAVNQHGLTREVYLSEAHLVIHSPGRTRDVFEEFLSENGFDRRVALTVPHMLSVPAVVRESDLIATVPQTVGTFFSGYPGIRVYPVPFHEDPAPPRTTVAQYWSRHAETDPATTWLRTQFRELFHEPDSPPASTSDNLSDLTK